MHLLTTPTLWPSDSSPRAQRKPAAAGFLAQLHALGVMIFFPCQVTKCDPLGGHVSALVSPKPTAPTWSREFGATTENPTAEGPPEPRYALFLTCSCGLSALGLQAPSDGSVHDAVSSGAFTVASVTSHSATAASRATLSGEPPAAV